MNLEDYPPQEPLNDLNERYQAGCFSRSRGIVGEEHAYASAHPCQGLMVYPAARPDGRCLIFIHGGGWTNGYKELVGFLSKPFNAIGITLVSVGHRLAPEFTFPRNYEDVAAAIAWVYRNAEKYSINRKRLYVGGHSSGAHLTALIAMRHEWQLPHGLPDDVIRGCLPISGTYDFTPGSGLAMRPRFLGPPSERNDVHASPIFNMSQPSVPFLLSVAVNDFPHLIMQAKKFEMVLAAKGGDVSCINPGGDHVTVVFEAAEDKEWIRQVDGWLNAHV